MGVDEILIFSQNKLSNVGPTFNISKLLSGVKQLNSFGYITKLITHALQVDRSH